MLLVVYKIIATRNRLVRTYWGGLYRVTGVAAGWDYAVELLRRATLAPGWATEGDGGPRAAPELTRFNFVGLRDAALPAEAASAGPHRVAVLSLSGLSGSSSSSSEGWSNGDVIAGLCLDASSLSVPSPVISVVPDLMGPSPPSAVQNSLSMSWVVSAWPLRCASSLSAADFISGKWGKATGDSSDSGVYNQAGL